MTTRSRRKAPKRTINLDIAITYFPSKEPTGDSVTALDVFETVVRVIRIRVSSDEYCFGVADIEGIVGSKIFVVPDAALPS